MRLYFVFVNVIIIVLSHSSITSGSPSKNYDDDINILEVLDEYDARFSFSNLWQKIKDSLKKAWDNIVDAAKVTAEKIKQWIYDLRLKVDEVLEKVKERLDELKKDIKDRLEEFAKQSEEIRKIVTMCYKEHKEEIEKIIKDTLQDIGKCIAKNKESISDFEKFVNPLNEDLFIRELKRQLDKCGDKKDPDECLKYVDKYVFEEISIARNEVSRNEVEVRNLLNNILDKIVKCTTDGVMKASEKLSKKVVDIGKCIKKEIKDEEGENYLFLK